jgi:hypothetical protein
MLTDTWRACADEIGLPGLHIIGFDHDGSWDPTPEGYDGAIAVRFVQSLFGHSASDPIQAVRRKLAARSIRTPLDRVKKPLTTVPYATALKTLIPSEDLPYDAYPCVVPNWDNTPRSGSRGSVLTGSTPELFARHLDEGVRYAERSLDPDRRLLFVKSWNEWAEGNYLEPDARWGTAYLDAFRRVIHR